MNGKELEGGKGSRGRCRAGVEGKASWWRKREGKQNKRITAEDDERPESKYIKKTHTVSGK